MATLLDRILKTNLVDTDSTIGIHAFVGGFWGIKIAGNTTRADVIAWFSITPSEEPSLDEILALPSGSLLSRVSMVILVWTTLMLGESGTITKADAKTRLGLSLG